MGHFARECRAQRNQDGWFKNQDNTRKQRNNKDTSSKVMMAIDGVGFDWSDMAEEQCNGLIVKLNQTEFIAATYKRGLATVEEQLVTYKKNEVLFSKEVAVLKIELACKDYEINVLKKPEFKGYGPRDSKLKSNINHDQKSDNSKENSDDSVKQQVSKDTSIFVESPINVDKETALSVDKKIKFVKPKNYDKTVRKSVREKGIKREYSIAKTLQQNRVAERRNRTLIEAARKMVLIVKPHNKTPYELFRGKFDGKSDEGLFVVYSLSSKAFRAYKTRTRKVEENLHIGFLENKHMIVGNGPKWLFDIYSLTQSINYVPVAVGKISNESADGTHNEDNDKDKSEDDSSPKEVNAAGQHVNTASLEVNTGHFELNTVDPLLNTASSSDPHSLTDMFKLGASDTLETTHVEFFSDRVEPDVDLGNIPNSYRVPTTLHSRIHKDHLIKNVIGEVQSFV
nr:hypothetical protein [Tanacetum cinerariifolium]